MRTSHHSGNGAFAPSTRQGDARRCAHGATRRAAGALAPVLSLLLALALGWTPRPCAAESYLLDKIRQYHPSLAMTVYSRDGEVLGYFFTEKRFFVEPGDLPPYVVRSFLAAEDGSFFEHEGIDVGAVFRAFSKNVQAGDMVQGGSTITQQVIKQLVVGPEKSVGRKLKEAVLALRLEKVMSKDEILRVYLNEIYFGAGAYGVEAAARTYFAKSAAELTVAEAALIAGLPRAPSVYNPLQNPGAAKMRQRYVLGRLHDLGWISSAQYSEALSEPLEFKSASDPSFTKGAYYLEEVRRWLLSNLAREQLAEAGVELTGDVDAVYGAGLKVYTAMDPAHQEAAETALREGLREVSSLVEGDTEKLQGSLLSIDPATGDVLAMVGGVDYGESRYNRATQAQRQPGSAFKPFVYSAALDAGFTAASVLDDSPVVFEDRQTGVPWEPKNFSDDYYGPVLLRTGLVKSLNAVTARLADAVGIGDVVARARAMGIEGDIPPYLSISLGSKEVSLINLCQAYTAFARGGSTVKPRLVLSVQTHDGREIYRSEPEFVDAISKENAFLMTYLLKQVVQAGTATVCRDLNRPAAGKTGTTNDAKDAWFIGFTPYLLTGVWVGYDEPASMGRNGVGGKVAAPIWLKYRQAVEDGYEIEDFKAPPGVVFARVDDPTAKKPDGTPVNYLLPFVKGTEPSK